MRQVIILHSRDLKGGACESVKLLIENIGHPVDLIVPKGDSDYITMREIKRFYGKNVNEVFEFFLPYNYEQIEGSEHFDLGKIRLRSRLFQSHKKELYRFFCEKKYEHIHLNSFGLYTMLNKHFPMTLHIRENVKGDLLQLLGIYQYLKQAKGLVFIDDVTKEPFKRLKVPNIVLANPVNQTMIEELSANEILEFFGFEKDTVIFTIAGAISEIKGQEFLIRTFNKFHEYPWKLLIVGDGVVKDIKKCTHLAEGNPDIVFLGQLNKKRMLEVYRITDYIVRAEAFFAIGRTVYEGLYSGANLIIQGSEKDTHRIDNYERYKDRIFSYLPRDEQSFLNVLHQINGEKVKVHHGETNVRKYSELFNQWVNNVVK